jgi:anti-sigma B factor antagonist
MRSTSAGHGDRYPADVAATDNLTVTVSDGDPVALVVDGQIDAHTAPELDGVLIGLPGDRSVTVDLSSVTFIDSSGLRVLVRADKRLDAGGGDLTLLRPSEPVRRLLEITGLVSALTIAP